MTQLERVNIERKLWEILVPATVDDMQVDLAHHREWDRKIKDIAGGLTILSTAKSYDSSEFFEHMIPVLIRCTSQQMADIASLTASHYRQRAIMYYKVSDEVHITRFSV